MQTQLYQSKRIFCPKMQDAGADLGEGCVHPPKGRVGVCVHTLYHISLFSTDVCILNGPRGETYLKFMKW